MESILNTVFETSFLATLNTGKLLELSTFKNKVQRVLKRQQDLLQEDKD
jgi:hypothetical protein